MQFPLGNIYERVRVRVCVLYILIRKKVTTSDYTDYKPKKHPCRYRQGTFFVVTLIAKN